jgi:hypothetical protein
MGCGLAFEEMLLTNEHTHRATGCQGTSYQTREDVRLVDEQAEESQ